MNSINGNQNGGRELSNTIPKYKIVAPIGGFGNHIRWIVLLDKKFNISQPLIWDIHTYNNLKDESWPAYSNFDKLPQFIKKECQQLLIESNSWFQFGPNVDDKVNFIKQNVYDKSRTHDKWLDREWKYRTQLDEFVYVCHESNYYTEQTLCAVVDPDLATKHYNKFNKITNIKHFKDKIVKLNQIHKKYNYINSDLLYKNKLDQEVYKKICDIFELDDNYTSANQIHKLWLDLQ